jgi:hypothetical protein
MSHHSPGPAPVNASEDVEGARVVGAAPPLAAAIATEPDGPGADGVVELAGTDPDVLVDEVLVGGGLVVLDEDGVVDVDELVVDDVVVVLDGVVVVLDVVVVVDEGTVVVVVELGVPCPAKLTSTDTSSP